MTFRLRATALLGCLLAVTAAGAQPPPSDIGPETIRQLALKLKDFQPAGLDPKMVDQIKDFLKQNPQHEDFRKLADKLRAEHPDLARQLTQGQPPLSNPQQLKQIENLLRQIENLPGLDKLPNGGITLPKDLPMPGKVDLPPGQPPAVSPGPMPEGPGLPPLPSGGPGPGPGFGGPSPDQLPSQIGGAIPQGGQLPNWQGGSAGSAGQDPQQMKAAMEFWERNVGSLNDTPAVRDIIRELFTGQTDASAGGGLGNLFNGEGGELSALGKSVGGALNDSGWKMPDLGGGLSFGRGPDGFSAPDAPSGPSFSGFGGGEGGSWLSVILFGVVLAFALVLWWVWPKIAGTPSGRRPRPLPGLGPWPVDPRAIADREALVAAFEYLSVLLCGTGAKVWNHVTIAAEFRRAAPQADDVADPLARLYELARYTPANEPLPAEAIAEARRHLCRLAGVPST